jgi:hypothetical protein
MKLNHVKLFEDFSNGEKVYATCFQGDAYAAVGILSPEQRNELQSAFDRALSEDPDLANYLRIEDVDVTGMGYIEHDEYGKFIPMPMGTNTSDYASHITKDGELGSDGYGSYMNDESRLFELVRGKMLSIDHHSAIEILPVREFIDTHLGY